ncbi:MAG: hypothetical protein M1840_002260 [Geoglossum simile]|nr:MAG: hypothetical protein M1840_002260 [Geoglossum simile]
MSSRRLPRDRDRFANMALLMGSTGSGKSRFINKLKEGATLESHSLYSYIEGTSSCQIVQTRIGRTNIAVVDSPGFNDTRMSDTEVLAEIASVLSCQYLLENKLKLRGILYLRDITKARMEGSDVRTLELFSKLIGKEAFPHVVFVTTKWGLLDERSLRVAEREMELKEDFWKEMILEGSYVTRFQDTKDSAEGIISQIVGDANPVILQIQHELVDKDMELAATSAGTVLAPIVEERLGASQTKIQRFQDRLEGETNNTRQSSVLLEIRKAEKERDQAQADKDRLTKKVGTDLKSRINVSETWQGALRTIFTVLGAALSVVSVTGTTCIIM